MASPTLSRSGHMKAHVPSESQSTTSLRRNLGQKDSPREIVPNSPKRICPAGRAPYVGGDHFVVRARFAWRFRWSRMNSVPTGGRSDAKRVYLLRSGCTARKRARPAGQVFTRHSSSSAPQTNSQRTPKTDPPPTAAPPGAHTDSLSPPPPPAHPPPRPTPTAAPRNNTKHKTYP
jgi:hypothetical protein